MHNSITVLDSRMPLVEYQSQRVVTFSMVDDAHQRPEGTAKATFNRNRSRFIAGEDFFIVTASKVNWGVTGYSDRGIKRTGKKVTIRIRGKVTLLTESGYLLLTKPFNDDLAWLVQRQLVKAYFRHIPQFPELRKVHVPESEELVAMPLEEAQHLIARVDRDSFTQHGQKGSAAMCLRRDELKKIRPAKQLVDEMGQIDWLKGDDNE
jgi:hypothetical protein